MELWIRTWWEESLISLSAKYRFEHNDYKLLWAPPPDAAETALYLLLESKLQQPYRSHVMVVTWLMKFSWSKQMGKGAELLFTVTVGIPFWGLGEHEPLIIYLFLSFVSRRKWKGLWTIQGSDWVRGTVGNFELECKR